MKKVKILLAVLLAAVMVIALVACNNTCKDGEHVWGTPKVNTAATCTTKGSQTKKCTVCGKEVTEDIPALDHDYRAQPYVSAGEEGHHQKCVRCDTYNDVVAHKLTKYTPVEGEQKHTVDCASCDYKGAAVACTIVNGVCTLCHANYGGGGDDPTPPQPGDKVTVKVHFHLPSTWAADKLKVYQFDKSGGQLFGDFPGTGKPTAEDGENAGWYVISFELVQSQITSGDAAVIFTDKETADGTGNQTGNITVNAAEIWVPGIAGADQGYTTKDAALAAENVRLPSSDDWIIAGMIGTANYWAETTSKWFNTFDSEKDYKLTLQFAANNEFKIKKNVSGWNDVITYSDTSKYTFTKDDAIEGDPANMFSGGENSNFKVKAACKLEFTFDPVAKSVTIKILDGTIPAAPTNLPKYIMVGIINGGAADWNIDSTKHPFVTNDDGTYTLTVSLKENDSFKVIEYNNSSWVAIWDGSTNVTITYAEGVEHVSDLFRNNGGNVGVNHNVTIEVTYTTAKKITVHVTALTKGSGAITWYIAGDLSGASWGASTGTAWKFVDAGEGKYTLTNKTLTAGKQFKIYGTGERWYSYLEVTRKGTAFNSTYFKDNGGSDHNIGIVKTCTVDITWIPATTTLQIDLHVA